jgi:hypothetical protein
MLRPLLSLRVFFLSAVITGCAPTMRVRVLQQAPTNLGTVKRMSLVQLEGHPDARDAILSELKRQASAGGYFQLTDRLLALHVTGGSSKIFEGDHRKPLAPDEVGLRLDVAQWDARMESKNKAVRELDGRLTATKRIDFYVAEVVLVATLFHPSGKPLFSGRKYRATARDDRDKNWALAQASAWAVSRLLRQVTPSSVTQQIRLDDDDEAQKPILQMAQQGDIPGALSAMESHVQQHPGNASALYNLAVLLDAAGRYSEALEHYDRAIALSNKDYYSVMKWACFERWCSQEALSQDIP